MGHYYASPEAFDRALKKAVRLSEAEPGEDKSAVDVAVDFMDEYADVFEELAK